MTQVDVRELVELLDRMGGGVAASELTYQLRRRGRGVTHAEVMDALCDAERRGLVTPWAWTLGPEALDT